ncbi:MAG: hypothetical protein J6X59_00415 [Bacteroidales bacterium]|nr:hypothetical protein [Bacteroidales bacterium]
MNTALDFIKAGRITNVGKLTSMSADYYPDGVSFSLFLAPKEDGDASTGDIMAVEAMLPESDGQYVEVPVAVGDWSPVVFRALKSGTLDLTDVDVYVAPIKEITL